jgi:hypothetical protein
VRDHAPGPSAAAAAGEDDRFRLVGRGAVEVLESRLRATLGRYGRRGARAPCVVECRRSLREAGVGIAGQRDSSNGTAGRQGRERRVCRNAIDVDTKVSDECANFTRTGEFGHK